MPPTSGATCWWCDEELPPWVQRNARTCSKSCRQKLARFRVAPAPGVAKRPKRFAYADPPYPGFARRLYGCAEVDHYMLIDRLFVEWPDGWALSTHRDALAEVLGYVRALAAFHGVSHHRYYTAAWHKGPRGRCKARRARAAWEPMIVCGGRELELGATDDLDDVLTWSATGRQHSIPGALIGMKNAAFAEWTFRQLGALRGDTLDDLFPGSGVMSRAWRLYQRAPEELHPYTRRPSRFEGSQQGDRRR